MLPLIYTDRGAASIFLVACLIWNVPEVVGAFKQRAKVSRKEASTQDRGSLSILIGLLLILLGVALRWYSIWTLGRYFTRDVAVSAGQQIVQHGPYRAIRHPAYSGTFLTMLGVGLAVTNWASLLVLLTCVLAGHLYRVQVEERALIQAIGQPYIAYMQRTRRFIPFVF